MNAKQKWNLSPVGCERDPKVVVVGSMTPQLRPLGQYANFRFVRDSSKGSASVFETLKIFVTLISTIISFWPKVVLVYPSYPLGIMTAFVAKVFRRKHICFAYGNDLVNRHTKIGKLVVAFTVKNSDGIICDYEGLVKPAIHLGGRNVVTIPMGIVTQGLPENLSAKKKKQNRVICVINFNLAYFKGIDFLIKAMEKLPDAKLVLVGDGAHRKMMMKLAKKLNVDDRVTFTGFVSQEELWANLLEAEVFVMPSRKNMHEGTNRATVEAMMAGLPVVVTSAGGFSYLVNDGVNGFVVEPENVDQLADAISKLLQDKKLREKMGTANKEKAKQFTVDVLTPKRIEYLYNIAKATKPSV